MKINFETSNYNTFGKIYKNQQRPQNAPYYYPREGYTQRQQPAANVRRQQTVSDVRRQQTTPNTRRQQPAADIRKQQTVNARRPQENIQPNNNKKNKQNKLVRGAISATLAILAIPSCITAIKKTVEQKVRSKERVSTVENTHSYPNEFQISTMDIKKFGEPEISIGFDLDYKNESLQHTRTPNEFQTSTLYEKRFGIVNQASDELFEEEDTYSKGQEYLSYLESVGGDAWKYFGKYAEQLNMTAEETMEYIVNLCEDKNFGNGEIDPIVLCVLMQTESYYNTNAIGDNGEAIGAGQIRPIALREVNRVYHTNYTYDDRKDPFKNLEMTVLLTRHCIKNAGSYQLGLAMYNGGQKNSYYVKEKSKKYSDLILSQVIDYLHSVLPTIQIFS